jgi:hypothetical protein
MPADACQVTLAHPASSGSLSEISCSALRGSRHARRRSEKLSNPQITILPLCTFRLALQIVEELSMPQMNKGWSLESQLTTLTR